MKHTIDELGPWGKAIPPNHSNIAALDTRRGGILILLPPSGADMPLPGDPSGRSARLRAKAGELICPVNGCGPYQTTVRNRKGRDHFRHRPATAPRQGHEPESLEHRAAKHAIAEWIHHQLNDLIERFEIDEYPITCADGTVLEPDVYVALRSGVQIAVEYQHSPGDVTTLERKQKAYEDSGIQVWWLFGPTRRTCPVIRKHPTKSEHQVQLTPAQTQLTHTKVHYFWYAASESRIGTPLSYRRSIKPRADEDWGDATPRTRNPYAVAPFISRNAPDANTVWLRDDALDSCRIDPTTGQLLTPTTQHLKAQATAARQEIRELRQRARHRYAAERKSAHPTSTATGEASNTDAQPSPHPVPLGEAPAAHTQRRVPPLPMTPERAPLPSQHQPTSATPAPGPGWWQRVRRIFGW